VKIVSLCCETPYFSEINLVILVIETRETSLRKQQFPLLRAKIWQGILNEPASFLPRSIVVSVDYKGKW
jgi:hypothetical protein